jgi:hypothetical protein
MIFMNDLLADLLGAHRNIAQREGNALDTMSCLWDLITSGLAYVAAKVSSCFHPKN